MPDPYSILSCFYYSNIFLSPQAKKRLPPWGKLSPKVIDEGQARHSCPFAVLPLLIFTGPSCGLAGGFLLGLRPGRLGGGLPVRGLRRRGRGLLVQQALGHRVELPELVLAKDILPDLGLGAVLHAHSHQVNDLIGQDVAQLDLAAAYAQRMSEVGKKGYGMFAKHHVFTVENGQLVPVKYPDPQRLSELPGYEKEREKVIANTKALLAGMPANNVLLYGDAGTGKSSAVKAIANEFAPEGLRLVEVKKNQLYQIPDLMDKLAANPLKFILFIDDLSFTANDDNFAALKAILEGSVGGRAQNIAVYATSNRRHLIKETLTDRTGDDIHEADTRQELMSLSARFGLTVTFQRPEKARFETILEELAKQHNIQMPTEQLLLKAEAFALRAGGRSPRVAKQFIEQCEAGVQK